MPKWKASEILAAIAIGLGFIIEVAPYLLLTFAQLAPLASTAPIQIGTVAVASNQIVGAVFLVIGIGFFWSVHRRRR